MTYAFGRAPGAFGRAPGGSALMPTQQRAPARSVAGCSSLPYALRSIYQRETDPERIAGLWTGQGELHVAFNRHLIRAMTGPRQGCNDNLPERDKAAALWLLRSCMALRLQGHGSPTPWAPPQSIVRNSLESVRAVDGMCRRRSLRGDGGHEAMGASQAGMTARWWQCWTLKQFPEDQPGWQWAGWIYSTPCAIAHLQNIENNCYATVDKARIAIRTKEGILMDVGRLRRICSGVEVL